MKPIIDQYRELLETVDRWFDRCLEQSRSEIACRRTCTGCCRGLFEISLLDAGLLQQGFLLLPEATREKVLVLANQRLSELQQQWPEFQSPYILNNLPHTAWQSMPEDDETPCPLLSEDGLCLVYEFRPMTCRLHGLPNIDLSGESFSDDYCSLNFREGDPLSRPDLRWNFRDTFRLEFDLLAELGQHLTGFPRLELDTFIPTALLIDFNQTDWLRLPATGTHQGS